MSKVRVVMNSAGIERVLTAACPDLERRGQAIKASADAMGSATYTMAARVGRKGGRPYVVVAANDPHAIVSNMKHNSLLKALNAGR